MNQPTLLCISQFDYPLPEALIARYPLNQRTASRLLYLPKKGACQDLAFLDLPKLLKKGDLLILNDTKVMKARLFGQKQTGGKIEMLVERIIGDVKDSQSTLTDATIDPVIFKQNNDQYWHLSLCHIKANKPPKAGQVLIFGDKWAMVFGRLDNLFVVGFAEAILPILETQGQLPIPPYFARQANQNDDTRYQTVFFDPTKNASVAAPTASLHFDDALLQTLHQCGVDIAFVTLHVGAGTFAPVKTQNISDHKMHFEYGELPQTTADKINQTKSSGGQVIAVGTTVVRVLETAFLANKAKSPQTLKAWQGNTNIFIYPPYQFGVVDRLISNFHLPKSTLLMLVSAFCGIDNIKNAYQHAIDEGYRFFSYGDAMLLDKNSNNG